jgi:hypothetical protein
VFSSTYYPIIVRGKRNARGISRRKNIFMEKKEKKSVNCIDCDKKTKDYYEIATNRGYISKCKECYELWICRTTRDEGYIKKNQEVN